MQFLCADHVLDTDVRERRCGCEPVAVEQQVLDSLIGLVRNRDRAVTKDDLIASVWGRRIVSDAAPTSLYAAREVSGRQHHVEATSFGLRSGHR